MARTIAACHTPIVAAVGHEIDFTIAEFVADHRAPTPSAAAEVLVPDGAELSARLSALHHRLVRDMERELQTLGQRVDGLERRMRSRRPGAIILAQRERTARALKSLQDLIGAQVKRRLDRTESLRTRLLVQHPARRLQTCAEQLAALWPRLPQATRRAIASADQRLRAAGKALHLISPLATLDRGYSLTFDASGKLIRSMDDAVVGDDLVTRTADGELLSKVAGTRKIGR